MAPSSEAGGMDRLNRRDLLGAGMAAGAAAWTLAGRAEAATQPRSPLSAGAAPTDRDYWRGIAAQYDLPPDVVQLENGNWGMMARPVVKAYERKIEMVNTATSLPCRWTWIR